MFEGWILDITDKERLLIFSESDSYHGMMILNYEHDDFYVGLKVRFETGGIMTLSLPPIVTPTQLEIIDDQRYFVIHGLLKSKNEHLLISTKNGDVIANIDPSYESLEIELGTPLYILYDGKMTRSMPPQVWVEKVIQDHGFISRNDIETTSCD